ncbi:MAG: ATP-binding protein [Bacteroidota bacterium]
MSNSMVKIVLTGPESTGKTTLTEGLAKHYNCSWIPEYARTYIEQLDRPYQQSDLSAIARGQLALEKQASTKDPELMICDTDLLTIKIWSEYKYGNCDPWILEQIHAHPCDWYFLCAPDIPWEPDPQREHPAPEQRQLLLEIYETTLRALDRGFSMLSGTREIRQQKAIDQIDSLLAGLAYNRFF